MKSTETEDVTSCNVVEGYNKLLEGTCCLHLQGLEERRCFTGKCSNWYEKVRDRMAMYV